MRAKNSRPAAVAAGLFFGSFLAAGAASAHSVLDDPPPRTPSDSIKSSPPCGGLPRTGAYKTYTQGDTLTVKFRETVDHTGCFVVALVEDGDTKVTVLKTLVDTAGDTTGATGAPHTMTVQFPAAASCERCALQLRQVMSGTATCDPATFTASTYLSCADIRINYADGGVPPVSPLPAAGQVDASAPVTDGGTATNDDAGTTGTGAGSTTSGTGTGTGSGTGSTTSGTGTVKRDGGRASNADSTLDLPANDVGGCNAGGGSAPFGATAALVMGVGLALAARRKRS